MKVYKSAVSNFLSLAKKYYQNGRTLFDMIEELESNIISERAWLNTDRAATARSNTLRAKRILAVSKALIHGEYVQEIGGQPIAGLACAWNTMDVTGIRKFLGK